MNFRSFGLLLVSSLIVQGCGSSSSNQGKPSVMDGGGPEGAAAPDASEGGAPVTGLMPATWTWVPVDQAVCRDGSPTGFAVNVANPSSDKLMIFLAGGGACFNTTTCMTNPASYGMSNFTSQFGSGQTQGGILDRTNALNPVKDWNMVYVPYCTGDVFSGNAHDVMVSGVGGAQQFVGYANMHLFLQRIAPTFPNLKQVLLTGVSAGGFGAGANYGQAAAAFAPVPVTELDDSGPPFASPDIATCLLDTTRKLWGLDHTIIAECGSDCSDISNYQAQYSLHIAKSHPEGHFGLVDTVDDNVITLFFGFGANNCAPALLPTPVSQDAYTKGLDNIRAQAMPYPNFGSFIFGDDAACNCKGQHTSLADAHFYSVTSSSGKKLVDWATQLIAGTVTNVGP